MSDGGASFDLSGHEAQVVLVPNYDGEILDSESLFVNFDSNFNPNFASLSLLWLNNYIWDRLLESLVRSTPPYNADGDGSLLDEIAVMHHYRRN
jgi:hypothetical protein